MDLDIYQLDAPAQYVDELRTRNLRLVHLRWLYVALISGAGISILALAGAPYQKKLVPAVGFIMVLLLLLNTLVWYRAKQQLHTLFYFKSLSVVQILLDLVMASTFVYAFTQNDGIGRATILYAIPIVATAILFKRGLVYSVAALCGLAYGLTSLVYYMLNPGTSINMQVIPSVVFYSIVFFVIAAAASYLSRINQKEIKQASYDELLATLTHQLRRPASTIAAAVEMLEHTGEKAGLSPEQKHTLEIIKEENSSALKMLAGFIESGRITSKKARSKAFKEIDLVEILKMVAKTCAENAHRSDDLKLMLPEKPVNMEGNPEQLPTAFTNLITNAFQYSNPGSEVVIELINMPKALAVHIVDHGGGITKKEQDDQAKRFLDAMENPTLSPSTKIGLGLYVSKRIIDYHGGKLIFESEPNKGTRVIIMFKRRKNA